MGEITHDMALAASTLASTSESMMVLQRYIAQQRAATGVRVIETIDITKKYECCKAGMKVKPGQSLCIVSAAPATPATGEVERLREALEKIDAIRNDIIGNQSVGWTRHIYPLVAALNEAGFKGKGYDEARAALTPPVEGA